MTRRRFYTPRLDDDRLTLDAEQAAHARKSLRLSTGDTVELFDGRGTVAVGRIEQSGGRMTVAVVARAVEPAPRPTFDLAVATPKGGRADQLVESATQLGVDRLIPLISERTVVEPRRAKLERFERIVIEACKQSRRARLMAVDEPTPLKALLERVDHDLRLIADAPGGDAGVSAPGAIGEPVQKLHEAGGAAGWPTKLRESERLIVLIGPEGGWSEGERRLASAASFQPWRFGPHVLRVETAALAAAAIVRAVGHGASW